MFPRIDDILLRSQLSWSLLKLPSNQAGVKKPAGQIQWVHSFPCLVHSNFPPCAKKSQVSLLFHVQIVLHRESSPMHLSLFLHMQSFLQVQRRYRCTLPWLQTQIVCMRLCVCVSVCVNIYGMDSCETTDTALGDTFK